MSQSVGNSWGGGNFKVYQMTYLLETYAMKIKSCVTKLIKSFKTYHGCIMKLTAWLPARISFGPLCFNYNLSALT